LFVAILQVLVVRGAAEPGSESLVKKEAVYQAHALQNSDKRPKSINRQLWTQTF